MADPTLQNLPHHGLPDPSPDSAAPNNRFALSRRTICKAMLLGGTAPVLAACQSDYYPKHLTPLPFALKAKMENLSIRESDPIFIRIFKEEDDLEVWKQGPDGRYLLLETYKICTWSGVLGPKFQEGDRQAPEGFYTINPHQMNPNSSFYLSFNLGFPNSYDRSHGRTGSFLMVHGACSSAGCYAMTDDQISEIYGLAREAFEGGQRAFQVHAFPFRMTPENMARHADHQHFAFWDMLQEGYQHFEVTRTPPVVDVCDRRYIFNAEAAGQFSAARACPDYQMPANIEQRFTAAQAEHKAAFDVALADIQRSAPAVSPSGPAVVDAVVAPDQVLVAQPAPVTPTIEPVGPLAEERVVAAAAPAVPVEAPASASGVVTPAAPPNAAVGEPLAVAQAPRQGVLDRVGNVFGSLLGN